MESSRPRSKSADIQILNSGASLYSSHLEEQFNNYYRIIKQANFRITREQFIEIRNDQLKNIDHKHQRVKVLQELKDFHQSMNRKKQVKGISQRQKQILLKNLKNNKQYFSMDDIAMNSQLSFPEVNSSQLLQSKGMQYNYEHGSYQEKHQILTSCLENMDSIYKDKYNNYILQKIIELGNKEHILMIYYKLRESLDQVVYDKFGAKVLIKIIEFIYSNRTECAQENQQIINSIVFGCLQNLLTHENGNFIVQKMIEIYTGQDLDTLISIIQTNIISLCMNKYGCLIIQKFIDIFAHKPTVQQRKHLDSIVYKILDSGLELSFKEYSNYIIQHILEAKQKDYQQYILYKILLPNFLLFSTDQYGSNVAEKAIVNSDDHFKKQVWKTLSNKNIISIVNNRFGNYVMQKFYQYSNSSIQQSIFHILKSNHQNLSNEGRFVWKTIIKQNENNFSTNLF